MRRLIAVKEVRYAGQNRHPGDEFEASELDAKILTATDISGGPKARYANEPTREAAISAFVDRQFVDPESDEEEETTKPASFGERVRRTYKRRDLKPEGN